MTRQLHVHLLPQLVPREHVAGGTVVVIDVLRATTTIVAALAAGATAVIPCGEIEEARQRAGQLGPAALLGGERGGRPIAGFDLGNSPAEYTAERVAGKTVVLTTTNGTRALLHCRQAARVLAAAFANCSATAAALDTATDIHLLCAGSEQTVSFEDTLLAGAIVQACETRPATANQSILLNDQALIAKAAWSAVQSEILAGAGLHGILQPSKGAQNLIEIGQAHDIPHSAQRDTSDLLAELDIGRWQIRRG